MIQLKRKEAIRLIKYHHLLHLSNEEKADIISDYNSKIKVYDKSNSLDFKEIQKYSNNKYILDRFSLIVFRSVEQPKTIRNIQT